MIKLVPNTAQMVSFVLVDGSCAEVAGLTDTWTIEVSKAGGAFAAGTGTKAEISDGWYRYTLPVAETDTIGPLALKITHATIQQQNLLLFVLNAGAGCTDRDYTVYTPGGVVIPNVSIQITTDAAGGFVVWTGTTDALGVARDGFGLKPCLHAGTYYFWRDRPGYIFDDPDTETFA